MNRKILVALLCGSLLGWFGHEAVEFFEVDACLDGGGAWDYQFEKCTHDR